MKKLKVSKHTIFFFIESHNYFIDG